MARTKRKQSSTGFYHIMTRGVNHAAIFEDDVDRSVYRRYLEEAVGECEVTVYAWCLMTNHTHMLVSVEYEALSDAMRKLNHRYSLFFNQRHGRSGHLFQERFKSEPVEDEPYLLTVTRYIHQNPVKAFMTPDCRYRWSSYGQYLGEKGFCNCDFILGAFGGIAEFLQFHGTVTFEDKCLEIEQRMDDDEAREYAERILGKEELAELRQLDGDARDACLRKLKHAMIPQRQIARITGVSQSTVSRA